MKKYRVVTASGTSYVVMAEEIHVDGDYIVLVADPRATVRPVAVVRNPLIVYEVASVTYDDKQAGI